MRQLMRLNVIQGTGKKADVKGYEVGGKTGTAEKPSQRRLPPKSPDQLVRRHVPDERAQVPDRGVARRAQGHRRDRRLCDRRHGFRAERQGDHREYHRRSTASCRATGAARRRSRSPRPRSPCPSRPRPRSWRRRCAAGRRNARRCRRAPAVRRRPHRECVALRLSELMGSQRLAARSGRCRPDARLPQGPARFSLRRPRRAPKPTVRASSPMP